MIRSFFMPEKEGMARTYLWTVAAGLLYAGSSFFMAMVVSHLLGAGPAGIFAIAMSIGNQLVTLGYYNMRTYQVSDVKEEYSFGDYAGFRSLSTAAMLVGGMAWILLKGYRGEKMAVILCMVAFKALEAASDLVEGRYQQRGRYDVSCRGVFVKTAAYLLAFLLVLLLTRDLLAAVGALTITYLASILLIDSCLMPLFGGFSLTLRPGRIWGLAISCLPIFLNSFCMTYIVNASKYAMDRYYSSEYLGYFNALYMMAFVVNLFSSFVLKPLINPLSCRFQEGDRKGFLKIVNRQLAIIGGITVLALAGAWLAGIPVLNLLFGLDLSPYRWQLCLILAGGSFTAVFQLFQYGLVIMRHQMGCLVGSLLTAGLTFLLTPILVKDYGITGAAAGYFMAMAFMAGVLGSIFLWFYKGEGERK